MVSGASEEDEEGDVGGVVVGVVGVVVGDSDGEVVVVCCCEVVGVTVFDDDEVVIGMEELSKSCRRSTSLLACNSIGSADATIHINDKIVRISGNNVNPARMAVSTTNRTSVRCLVCMCV